MTTTSNTDKASANSSEYQDGLAFRFKFPKGTNLSLRAADIKDGIPKLRFSTSYKVSTITEEDVATCVRLCLDGKRPEFFYTNFLPGHPFAATGRHYMQYKPAYLKGTSVGELFAEADWKMKCLDVGVLSDDKKETFRSWPEASKLDGLATYENFPSDEEGGSSQVLMTCESVDVSESENELLFIGEPKMKIDDKRFPLYTEYITDNFDSVAYHDEPLFLKMKEVVKLMLAVEWLRDNDVNFSEEWVKEHADNPTHGSREPVQVKLSDEETNRIMEQLQQGVDSAIKQLPPVPGLTSSELDTVRPECSLMKADQQFSETGFELKLETTHAEPVFEALTGLYVPVVTKVVVRATLNDFDYLCQGMDPNEPVTIDTDSNDLVKPGVNSWSELYRETMPFPCKWQYDPENPESKTILTGGVTTSTIPVRKTVPTPTPVTETAQVRASTVRKREKVVCSSSQTSAVKRIPPKDVRISCTTESKMIASREVFGWMDSTSCSVSTSEGVVVEQRPPLHGLIKATQLIGGKEVGPPVYINMQLPLPLPSKQDTTRAIDHADKSSLDSDLGDSAYSSLRSLTTGTA